jgi:Zn-finger nucleic acid-binding protein
MQMTCPKCHGEMRHYERSGVTLDQCADCRGIFLDRGELERIVDAESAWQTSRAPQQPPPPPQPQYQQQPPPYQPPQPHYDDRYGYEQHGHHKRKKRESFFEELFD